MNPTLTHPLALRLGNDWPPRAWCDSHIVLAVSSGPDSVALLRAVLALKADCGGKGTVFAAHLNHGIRGAEADADQTWLDVLCRRLEVPLELGHAPTPEIASAQGNGLEAAARHARYEFLGRTAERLGARFVAVAHSLDDQVETILHRILRGTGLTGLAGMPASRSLLPSVSLIRPLLAVPRSDILDYLQTIGQDYRIDPSNADTRFTRNRLRHDLLPLLGQQYNAGVKEALLRLGAQARESQSLTAKLAEKLASDCVILRHATPPEAGARAVVAEIDCSKLNASPPLLVREMCRVVWQRANWPMQAMGFELWRSLAGLVQGEPLAPINLPGDLRAKRISDRVVIKYSS